MANARFEHSNFFTVNGGSDSAMTMKHHEAPLHKGGRHKINLSADPRRPPTSDYERFNCNNFGIRLQSWNYRGCWHQTCPLLAPR